MHALHIQKKTLIYCKALMNFLQPIMKLMTANKSWFIYIKKKKQNKCLVFFIHLTLYKNALFIYAYKRKRPANPHRTHSYQNNWLI